MNENNALKENSNNKELTELMHKCYVMKAYGIIGCPKFLD